jgi:RNA polymerase-binding transcription factor DksA
LPDILSKTTSVLGDTNQLQIRPNTAAELNLPQLEYLALELTGKRDVLLSSVRSLNQKIASREDCSIADAAEAACHREEAARAMGIAEQHNHTIGEIDHALRKLSAGNYGSSEASGEPIDHQRLLLVPWARTGSNE